MNTLKIYLDEVNNLYKVIDEVMEMFNSIQTKNIENLQSLITQNNTNIEKTNDRLNQMDLEIEDNNKLRIEKNKKTVIELNETYDNEKKKNTSYKSELTKKFNKLKGMLDTGIDVNNKDILTNTNTIELLKVETKENKNKELEHKIRELEERLRESNEDFTKYKDDMIKTITALKNEIKIRTRQIKVENKVKGISIK